MHVIYPIVFKFGDILAEPLDDKTKAVFLLLSKKLLNASDVVWANDFDKSLESLFFTTNILKQTIQESPDYISTRFYEWLIEKTRTFIENKFLSSDSVFLIDLRGIDRDQQIYHLSILINKLFFAEQDNKPRVILILEKTPLKEDLVFKHLFKLEEVGKVIYIEKTNEILTSNKTSTLSEIQLNKIYPQEVTKATLKGKLIKKIGHFKPDNTRDMCSRHFYDASFCDIDIRKLTLEFIFSQSFKPNDFEYIFYISKVSPWLRESLSALSGDIEVDLKDQFSNFKGAFNYEKIDSEISNRYKGGHILLVADFINTSKSIKNAIIEIHNNIPDLDESKLILLSVLNNLKYKEHMDDVRSFEMNSKTYNVPYFSGVEIEAMDTKDCTLCNLSITHSDLFKDDFLGFRSYDFWDLADKNGYEFEKIKPSYVGRKKLYVPKFLKWLNENSAYLSYKFHNFLQREKLNTKLNCVIIYPDEALGRNSKKNNIQTTASGLLAKKIKEIFGQTNIIGIPRDIIDLVINKQAGEDTIIRMTDDWKTSIRNIPPNTDIIILDEFNKSGKTFESMKDIIVWLGQDIKCFFTIADFNPVKTKEYRDHYPHVEFYSLYEFNNKLFQE